MAGVVGRDAELSAIRALVESVSDGAAAVVLEGEAGMGKTTLWSAGVAFADEQSLLVLEARPAESEVALTFCALGDLLHPVLEEALAGLPDAQKRALSRALVLGDDEGPPPDPHAVGIALLNGLRALAETRPVLLAIDDVQWLDPASAGALAFAVRRLRGERVGVLFARRTGVESVLLDEVARCLPPARSVHVDVGPLDVADLHGIVQEHLGVALPRPLLAEVREASGGNPFYALEIVRMLRRTGTSVEAGHPLPVPESLHELVHSRLLALPPESRQFLLAASAHAHPTLAVTEAASGVPCGQSLPPALEARIVTLDGDRLRFTHPLLAAGAYETADPLRRAEVHARLAELLERPEARAWQLAASVDEPDEAVATVLEEAAWGVRSLGAPRPAALLLDRARELTPADSREDAVRRAVEAAKLHFESGDSPRAEAQLRDVIAPLEPGPLRARAMVVLARIRLYEAPSEAKVLFAQVIEEAGDDRRTLALAHEGSAAYSIWVFERFDEALWHTDIALALADELGDEALAGDVLMARLTAETMLGRSAAAATAERALTLQRSATDLRALDQPLASLAEYWIWIDEHARSRDALVELLGRARDVGDENACPWLLCLLGEAERRDGDLEKALELAREAREAADQSGQPLFSARSLALESAVLAQLGRPEEARQSARHAREVNQDRFTGVMAGAAVGHLELSLGTPGNGVAQLEELVALVRGEGIVEPGTTHFVTDCVEALIELGRRSDAVELLDWYEGNARRLGRASALANCMRCRGLLAAQDGDLEAASAAFAEALASRAAVELPLDRGRTLLALGAAQRRAKRRREARATLEEALGIFERIGAALWAERAREEIKRISGRAATPGALTPSEQRVAALVAEGKTNREVAAALFLSERTVEGHLSHAFAKLGVRSRTELARALAGTEREAAAPKSGGSPVSGVPSSS
jgi:DNA-binding CsgD family transcriptional regulator